MSDEVALQRARIEDERRELGQTVQALADKFDVRSRTKDAVASTRAKIHDNGAVIWTAVGAAAAVILLAMSIARRRRRYR